MNDIFIKEVEQDIREENLWQHIFRWAPWAGLAAAVVFLTWGGLTFWHSQQRQVIAEISDLFDHGVTAYEKGEYTKARDIFRRVISSPARGYVTLARMYQTALLKDDWEVSRQDNLYQKLKDTYAMLGGTWSGKAWTQGMHLMQVYLTFDENPLQDVSAYITPQNPWRHSVFPLIALKQKDPGAFFHAQNSAHRHRIQIWGHKGGLREGTTLTVPQRYTL